MGKAATVIASDLQHRAHRRLLLPGLPHVLTLAGRSPEKPERIEVIQHRELASLRERSAVRQTMPISAPSDRRMAMGDWVGLTKVGAQPREIVGGAAGS
jgi:hypothetical protein